MLKKILITVALPVVLAACASTQSISTSDKAKVKAVRLNGSVGVPQRVYYLGPGGANALAFGAIGGALGASGIEKERANFQQQTGSGGTGIDRIVLEEVRDQFQKSGKFKLIDKDEPGAAILDVTVTTYGFSIPHGFSSKLVPILGIRCEMKDSTGRIIWSDTENARPLGNPVDSIDADVIKTSVTAREQAWRAAAKALAARMAVAY